MYAAEIYVHISVCLTCPELLDISILQFYCLCRLKVLAYLLSSVFVSVLPISVSLFVTILICLAVYGYLAKMLPNRVSLFVALQC